MLILNGPGNALEIGYLLVNQPQPAIGDSDLSGIKFFNRIRTLTLEIRAKSGDLLECGA